MNRRTFLAALMATSLPFPANATQCRDGADNAQDVDWLITLMAARYAYLPDRHIDLEKLRRVYVAEAGAVCEPHAFLNVLERFLGEFHDHHIEATVNNAHSPQLVPSGTDLWASMRSGRATIEQVRPHSDAARAGVRAGDGVVSIGGIAAAQAVAARTPEDASCRNCRLSVEGVMECSWWRERLGLWASRK